MNRFADWVRYNFTLRDENDIGRYYSQLYDITLKDITVETGIILLSELLKISIV